MGLVLAGVCALAYATMSVLVRVAGRRGGADNGVIAALSVNIVMHGSVVLVRLATGSAIDWRFAGVIWFVVSGVLTTLLGRLALYAGIDRIGASRAAPIKNLAPFVTVSGAIVLLGERLTPVATAGVAIALVAYAMFIVEGSRGGLRAAAAAVPVHDAAAAAVPAPGVASAAAAGAAPPDYGRRFGVPHAWLGYVACTAAATFYGVGTIVRKVGVEAMPDPYVAALVSAVSGFVVYAVYLASRGQLVTSVKALREERQPYYWLAGVASSVGQLSLFIALSLAPASIVSVVSSSDTILTLLLGAVFLGRHEGLNRWVVVAAAGVFVATVLIALG